MADNTVALQTQTPDSMKTIGSMINFAKGAQELQSGRQNIERGGLALKQETMDLQERNALRDLSTKLGQYKTESGDPDYPRLIEDATKVAPKHGMKWVQDVASSHVQSIAAQSSLNKLSEEQRAQVGQVVMSVADQPYAEQEKAIKAVVEGNPQLKHWADISLKRLQAVQDPAQRRQVALKLGQSTMSAGSQATAMQPSGYVANTGQTQQLMNTNPLAGATGPVAGTQVQNQIPPTATTVTPTGQPAYVGPQGGGGARPVPAGNPPGLEASAAGSAATANKDWESTVEAAKTASGDIANLTNIKRFASSAQTGVGADRRAFVAGLAGLVGIDYGEMTKTKTDLLAKNANMLALAGGDTNLAKTLAESANPNTHMTKEAILEAANQVMSQRRMALAKQDFLRSHKALNNPDSYNSALTEWNKVADPRIFQWPHMTPEEKRDMKSSMTEKEQQEFRDKVKRAVEIGIVK